MFLFFIRVTNTYINHQKKTRTLVFLFFFLGEEKRRNEQRHTHTHVTHVTESVKKAERKEWVRKNVREERGET